jgi:hypothetical protein
MAEVRASQTSNLSEVREVDEALKKEIPKLVVF